VSRADRHDRVGTHGRCPPCVVPGPGLPQDRAPAGFPWQPRKRRGSRIGNRCPCRDGHPGVGEVPERVAASCGIGSYTPGLYRLDLLRHHPHSHRLGRIRPGSVPPSGRSSPPFRRMASTALDASRLGGPSGIGGRELCANAARHGDELAGLKLILGPRRHCAPRVLRLLVIDHAPDRAPELPGDNGLFSERGRGLRMAESLAWRWGWHRMGFDEKQVWCTFVIEPRRERQGLSSGFQ
jgi:hypothetical protein